MSIFRGFFDREHRQKEIEAIKSHRIEIPQELDQPRPQLRIDCPYCGAPDVGFVYHGCTGKKK